MHVPRSGWEIAVCSSCSVVGLRWWAGVCRVCVPVVVSCYTSCLFMHSKPSRLFVTDLLGLSAIVCATTPVSTIVSLYNKPRGPHAKCWAKLSKWRSCVQVVVDALGFLARVFGKIFFWTLQRLSSPVVKCLVVPQAVLCWRF